MSTTDSNTHFQSAIFFAHIEEAMQQSGLSLQEILSRLRIIDIDAIEFDAAQLSDPLSMKILLDSLELKVSSIYQHFDFGVHPIQESDYALIDLAVTMGADHVMAIPGFYHAAASDLTGRQQEFQSMVQAMTALCAYGHQRGVQVLMEDFDDEASPFSTLEGLYQLMIQVPGIGCAFDTGNFRFSGQDELEAFETLRPFIKHMHLKDRRYTGVEGEVPKVALDGTPLYSSPVGGGEMQIKTILERLSHDKYDGYYAIEHFGAPDQLRYMWKSITWMKKHI